jgi:hypothetical protein
MDSVNHIGYANFCRRNSKWGQNQKVFINWNYSMIHITLLKLKRFTGEGNFIVFLAPLFVRGMRLIMEHTEMYVGNILK